MFFIDMRLVQGQQAEYRTQAQVYQRGELWARVHREERRAQRVAAHAQRLAERSARLAGHAQWLAELAAQPPS